jgi:hypothetical protein
VMLGQLAKNISIQNNSSDFQNQEVFVVGFYGLSMHIARGFFTTNVISRVHCWSFECWRFSGGGTDLVTCMK